jgi:hypothetical protein
MNPRLRNQTILAVSLAALFASGVIIGRLTAPASPAASAPTAQASSWAETASRTLANDLQLDESQQQGLDRILVSVGESLGDDQETALFTMYLRMLRVHDTISAGIPLSEAQSSRLAASRAKLKGLIIERFPQKVSENPKLALDPSSED